MGWRPVENPSKEEASWLRRLFGKKTRFLVDEDLDPAISRILRELGWNTKSVSEVGLRGRSDEAVFAYAWRHKRVLITCDRGYLDDRRFPEHRNPGVVVLPEATLNSHVFVGIMRDVLQLVGPFATLWRGSKLVFSKGGEVTITDRNRDTGMLEKTRYRFTSGLNAEIWVD